MKSHKVKVWAIKTNVSATTKRKSYTVRWVVAGEEHSQTFGSSALADNYRTELKKAVNAGEAFDAETGLPDSMAPKNIGMACLELVQKYVVMKWPEAAPKSRRGMIESLVAATIALVPEDAKYSDLPTLRTALRNLLVPMATGEPTPDEADALRWLKDSSAPLEALTDTQMIRRVLDALSRLQDGTLAAAATRRRKRAIFYNLVEYGIELGLLGHNPIDRVRVRSRTKKVVEEVDRRVVANPKQVRAILSALCRVGKRNRNRGLYLRAFFACLYFAALRPGEALGLRQEDCHLPKAGFGRLTVDVSRPEAGKRWTDTGEAHDERGLKHRPEAETRPVPIPEELVHILRTHIRRFGVAPDGRLFVSAKGNPIGASSYARVWGDARKLALPGIQARTVLVARPYDLRHGGVSLWLNAGVPPTEVAARAGHSVEVLLKVYAKCIDGDEAIFNERIAAALRG